MLRFIVDVAIPHSFIKVLFHHFEVRHRNKSRSETRWRAAQRELCLHSTVVRRTLDCDRFVPCFGGKLFTLHYGSQAKSRFSTP